MTLSVYYCIDLPHTYDTELIERCLRTHITVTENGFDTIEFSRYFKTFGKNDDVIKNGLYTFNKMYNDLKLKKSNTVWFIYIGNGNIKNLHRNVYAILLNRDPSSRSCYYSIHKNPLYVLNESTKDNKMKVVKDLNKGLYRLFATKHMIAYDNFM